jgi:hypothetical protein
MTATLAGTATPHRLAWGSDIAEVSLRYGWPDRWAREEDVAITLAPPAVRVVGDEPTPSFSFVPDRHALESPFAALPNDWQLVGDHEPPMRYAPGWLRKIDTLPVQIARFRRAGGDSMTVVAVYDARASLRDDTDHVSAAAVLALAPESTVTVVHPDAAPLGVVTLAGPARPALAAVEVVDSAGGRAARWRAGVAPLARSALVSDLLVGLAGHEPLPLTLDSAARRVIASLRVTPRDTIALYWESYARATPGHPARVSLRLTALSGGVLERIARSLGLAHAGQALSMVWDDPGAADASVGRSLRIAISDVPPGRYRIELVVEADGVRDAAAREIVVGRATYPSSTSGASSTPDSTDDNRCNTVARSGVSSSTRTAGSVSSRSMRSTAVLIVNALGSRDAFTSSHCSGIETVAPGSGRTLNGATMVWP